MHGTFLYEVKFARKVASSRNFDGEGNGDKASPKLPKQTQGWSGIRACTRERGLKLRSDYRPARDSFGNPVIFLENP